MKFKQLREKYRSKYPASLVAAAVKIAIDMGGNMTGAYKKIEAMKRGLADDPIVADALKQANESVNEDYAQDLDLAQKNMARLAKKEKGQDKKDYEAVARALNQGNLGAVKKVIKGISTDEIRADILNVLVGYNDLIAKMYPKAVDSKGRLKSGMSVGKMIKEDTVEEAVSPEEKAQLALKHAKELETLKKKHEREKENMKEEEAKSPAQQAAIAIAKKKAKKVVENYMAENYRTLAKKGMGAETKKSIKVGTEIDYYRADGAKYMGKVTRMTPTTYIVKDTKNGKNYQFTYHDRVKAKALLKK